MNLRQLIDEFRTQAQDKVRPYLWPDDELTPWAADAESEASIRARLIHDTEEIEIGAGETAIDLPSGLFDIQYAEIRPIGGAAKEIVGTDRTSLNAARPGWRNKIEPPVDYIHDDKTLTFGCVPDVGFTLYLEFFRTPSKELKEEGDTPEIHVRHHLSLVDWMLFRAYSKPDADTLNPGKAKDSEDRFTEYFGPRPDADLRRRQNANRPHRNRLHL